MSTKIDIEYCGSWGYGGPASRVKKAINAAFPDIEINMHSANGKTGVIKVSWVRDGKMEVVWSKGRDETEKGHAEIVALLKQSHHWKISHET